MRELEWRWADPHGQQRLVREDELRAGLANGAIPPNAPVWRQGWKEWKAAFDVPELSSSALAAANGLVPNIPPPPMFILEAQNKFEGKSAEVPAAGGEEPPPPPRYEPQAPFQAASTERTAAPEPKQPNVKHTIPGPAPPPANAEGVSAGAVIIPVAPPTPTPHVANSNPPAPPLGTSSRSKQVSTPPPPAAGSRPGGPPASPSSRPGAAKRGPEKVAGETEKNVRSTLIFGEDGAPPVPTLPTTKEGASPSPSPIVVPAPGAAVAEKNAITRPPPWGGEGAARMGTSDSPEEPISNADLFEADDLAEAPISRGSVRPSAGRRISTPPPVPKKSGPMGAVRSLPPVLPGGVRSMPPPLPGRRSSLIPSPTPAPVTAKTTSKPPPPARVAAPTVSGTLIGHSADLVGAVAPKAPDAHSDKPTLVGFDPGALKDTGSEGLTRDSSPTQVTAMPIAALEASSREASEEGAAPEADAHSSDTVPPPRKPFTSLIRTDELPIFRPTLRQRLDPFIDKVPPLRTLREKRPELLIPVIGGAGALISLLALVGLSNAISGSKTSTTDTTKPSTSASGSKPIPSPSATTIPAASAATTAPSVETKPIASPSVPCTLNGEATKAGVRGLVALGVEVTERDGLFAIGFAPSEKEGQALRFTDGLVAKNPPDRKRSPTAIRRVIPILGENGKVRASVDTDGNVVGRRSAAFGSYDFGMKNGQFVAVKKNGDASTNLWPLEGEGPVEALRVAKNRDGWVIAFRRQGKIFFGRIKSEGGSPVPDGILTTREPIGTQVGSPSIAMSGETLLLVWAELIEGNWSLRTHRVGPQGEATATFTPPAGGPGAPYLSPGVTGLGDGRFFLLWTEGKGESHAVRGATLSDRGMILGDPLTLSASDLNAGQGQAAVDANGHGLVSFLAGTGKVLDIMVAGVTCTSK